MTFEFQEIILMSILNGEFFNAMAHSSSIDSLKDDIVLHTQISIKI